MTKRFKSNILNTEGFPQDHVIFHLVNVVWLHCIVLSDLLVKIYWDTEAPDAHGIPLSLVYDIIKDNKQDLLLGKCRVQELILGDI